MQARTLHRAIFMIGSNVRQEQPIVGHCVRQAFLSGAEVSILNCNAQACNVDPIAKAIVDNHQGTIAIESSLDSGTTLTVTLPQS